MHLAHDSGGQDIPEPGIGIFQAYAVSPQGRQHSVGDGAGELGGNLSSSSHKATQAILGPSLMTTSTPNFLPKTHLQILLAYEYRD